MSPRKGPNSPLAGAVDLLPKTSSMSEREVAGSERNGTIELLRVVSACGIIWFHSEATPFRRIGFAGLVFFLIVSVLFQKRSAERSRGSIFFSKRASRLLVPWAAWFVIYGLLNLGTGKPFFRYTSGFFADLLCGPWIGLWFLPFSFVTAGLVYGLINSLRLPRLPIQFFTWAALSLLTLGAVSWLRASSSPAAPWAQWLQAAPSIPIGLAFACAAEDLAKSRTVLSLFQASVLVACIPLYFLDPGIAICYGLGSALVTIGLVFKSRLSPPVGRLSALCLGVYLIHGAVMSAFKIVPWVTQHYLPWFILTTLVSFIAIALLRRMPWAQSIC